MIGGDSRIRATLIAEVGMHISDEDMKPYVGLTIEEVATKLGLAQDDVFWISEKVAAQGFAIDVPSGTWTRVALDDAGRSIVSTAKVRKAAKSG